MIKTIAIEKATLTDWPAMKEIYLEGIATGNATFVTSCGIPDGKEWFSKKVEGAVLKALDEKGEVIGWAALQPISGACNYSGVAEVSVYVSMAAQGRGVGSQLLQALIVFSEANNIWTLQASIFPENKASLYLHEKHGFTLIGKRKAIGQLHGVWRDELLLERRSSTIY